MLKLALRYELKTESLAFLMGIIEKHENVYSEKHYRMHQILCVL